MRPLSITLVEPNEPDARWFAITMSEHPAIIFHYSTGVEALRTWTEHGAPAIDLIVMSDILPMLTPEEFIDRARAWYPDVPVVVIGERIQLQPVSLSGVDRLTKPVTAEDIRTIQKIVFHRRMRIRRAA